MITREVIDTLYNKYHKSPNPADTTDMALLFDCANSYHSLSVNEEAECLTIGSVATTSPFNRISLRCIKGVVPFDHWVAIVMHSSILFLSRFSSDVNVHIKPIRVSFFEKFCRVCAL